MREVIFRKLRVSEGDAGPLPWDIGLLLDDSSAAWLPNAARPRVLGPRALGPQNGSQCPKAAATLPVVVVARVCEENQI